MELCNFIFDSVPVRTLTDETSQVWFIAKDVATALGYKDYRKAVELHCKECVRYHKVQTAGGLQDVRIILEADVRLSY